MEKAINRDLTREQTIDKPARQFTHEATRWRLAEVVAQTRWETPPQREPQLTRMRQYTEQQRESSDAST